MWKNKGYWNFVMQGDRYQSNDSTFHNWTNMGPMVGTGEHSGQWWIPMPNQTGDVPPPDGTPNYIVNIGGGDRYLWVRLCAIALVEYELIDRTITGKLPS